MQSFKIRREWVANLQKKFSTPIQIEKFVEVASNTSIPVKIEVFDENNVPIKNVSIDVVILEQIIVKNGITDEKGYIEFNVESNQLPVVVNVRAIPPENYSPQQNIQQIKISKDTSSQSMKFSFNKSK